MATVRLSYRFRGQFVSGVHTTKQTPGNVVGIAAVRTKRFDIARHLKMAAQ